MSDHIDQEFARLMKDFDEPWQPLQRYYEPIIKGYAPRNQQPEQDNGPLVMAGIALVLAIIGAGLAFRR